MERVAEQVLHWSPQAGRGVWLVGERGLRVDTSKEGVAFGWEELIPEGLER